MRKLYWLGPANYEKDDPGITLTHRRVTIPNILQVPAFIFNDTDSDASRVRREVAVERRRHIGREREPGSCGRSGHGPSTKHQGRRLVKGHPPTAFGDTSGRSEGNRQPVGCPDERSVDKLAKRAGVASDREGNLGDHGHQDRRFQRFPGDDATDGAVRDSAD